MLTDGAISAVRVLVVVAIVSANLDEAVVEIRHALLVQVEKSDAGIAESRSSEARSCASANG